MLTALISLVSGLVTGVVPELLKEFRESRDARRERDFLKLQHDLEMERLKAGTEDKMREAEANLVAEELRAFREHLTTIIETQGRPTGIVWIDGFNALLRPLACTGIILLFFWVAAVYTSGIVAQYGAGAMSVDALNQAVWGSIVGEGILAVLGFLFGYRGAVKVSKS